VSGFGIGFAALIEGLAAGRSAIRPISCFDASPLAARVASQVPVDAIDQAWVEEHLPGARGWLEAGALRDRKCAFAALAALEAWRSAGLEDRDRAVPLLLAVGLERALLGDLAPVARGGAIDWTAERALAGPRFRVRAAMDWAPRVVADLLDLRGPTVLHASACAAGAMSLAHAAALIGRGDADLVLCGAADSMLDPIGLGGMAALGATSAAGACRPFDRRRDGLVMGEGAALFVVEEEGRARRRGARVLARVLGWGTSQDAYKPSAPEPDGVHAARAISSALLRAALEPAAVEYVNAHGTGTVLNDLAEAAALHRAGVAAAPVSSVKGAICHLMAASGAIELAATLLAFERDLLPGTAGHAARDPDIDLDVIGEAPRSARVGVALSTSFGFGGQNAAVLLGRPT
jgi:3-oxoacyl-(acyl-carrier-protein) synthase